MTSTIYTLITLSLAAATAQAAAPDAGKACVAIEAAPERLACYDKAFGRSPLKAPAPPAAAAAPAAAVASATAPPPAPPTPTTPPTEDKFGFTTAQVEQTKPPEKPETDQLAATVAKLERQPTGELITTLDNDQVWVQREKDSRAVLRVGDAVTIRKASLGSYLMVGPNGIATRVRRLK